MGLHRLMMRPRPASYRQRFAPKRCPTSLGNRQNFAGRRGELTKEKGILLTGDLELREEAKKRKVTVHGLLWILEQLIQEKRLKPPEAAKALRLVLAKNAYLPPKECERLLSQWEK